VPRLRASHLAPLALVACAPATVGTFPAADPELHARNESSGDPYAGRFSYEEAVAGLGEGRPMATLKTDAGEVHCELAFDTAPLAVSNFIGLARGLRPFQDAASGEWRTEPYYENLSWHRVEERQFVQTGLHGDGPGADASVGFTLQDERSIGDAFDRPGVMALANDARPHTSAAQFFVTTAELRGLDGKYTIIGRCSDQVIVRELERRALAGGDETPRLLSVEIHMEAP
jgi:peptidyl-prolyl cis-trans isomerase A (cyclophilin A)